MTNHYVLTSASLNEYATIVGYYELPALRSYWVTTLDEAACHIISDQRRSIDARLWTIAGPWDLDTAYIRRFVARRCSGRRVVTMLEERRAA